MKKIALLLFGITVLSGCGDSANEADYAYVKSLLAADGADATFVKRQGDKIVNYIVTFKEPDSNLVRIASKKPNAVFDWSGDKYFNVRVLSGYVLVSVVPDDYLQGKAAKRGCNYKLLYLPADKDNEGIFSSNKPNSVELCEK